MKTTQLLVILILASTAFAKEKQAKPEPKHLSLHFAPMIVCQSFNVGLEPDEVRALTTALTNDPRWEQTPDTIDAKSIQARNALAKEVVRKHIPRGRRTAANRCIVQHYFMTFRPDLALDWMEKKLSPEQRRLLQQIPIPKNLKRQLEHDRMSVIIHELAPHYGEDFKARAGKLFYFGVQRPSHDIEETGDIEALQLLTTPAVQEELKMTGKQIQQVVAAIKELQKSGRLRTNPNEIDFDDPCADFGIGEFPDDDESSSLREDAIAKAKSIVKPEHHSRFDELLAQRYMMFNESLSPLYIQTHFGEEYSDRWSAKIEHLPTEVLAVRQMRIVAYVKSKTEEIMGEDLTRMLGPPDTRKTFGCKIKPKLESPIAAALMPKPSANPRRTRRR